MKITLPHLLIRLLVFSALLAGMLAPQNLTGVQAATQTDIQGPAGSGQFGYAVTFLPNGNWVVSDPYYDEGDVVDVGAVYLYDGSTNALISTLTGSTISDTIGSNGIQVLPNGKFLVLSPHWSNGYSKDAGAATLCSIETGCNGVVSASNSLVGNRWDDLVSSSGITVMPNGSYLVRSPFWDNGKKVDAGAVTWCNNDTGCASVVSATNSLVGGRPGDHAGEENIIPLRNGNYLVPSPAWNNDKALDAGAVTWCSGETGCSGVITTTNSLVGSTLHDRVGSQGVLELVNGNYLVSSPAWDYDFTTGGALTGTITHTVDAGAVTWCSSETGCSGPVTVSNSLIGGTDYDRVGSGGVIGRANTSYLILSPSWDRLSGFGKVADVGAVTYCNGETGCRGLVSPANSLVGSKTSDQTGGSGIVDLVDGNYVVNTPTWDNGNASDAGAVTWCNGETGCTGIITATNSLVGSTIYDRVGGSGVLGLANGNYLVASVSWDNRLTALPGQVVNIDNKVIGILEAGAMDTGAVTWCSGETGCVGAVSAANSLVGTKAGDKVGSDGVVLLPNGNYLVRSSIWDDRWIVDAGAVTLCSGETGCTGTVTASNSLVGSNVYDKVGLQGITLLANSNYVVVTSEWDKGPLIDVGAVTWCNGDTGCAAAISAENSLTGSHAYDRAGDGVVAGLVNASYVVISPGWDLSKQVKDAGAATWCDGEKGCSGPISAENSLVGGHFDDRVGSGGISALANSNYVIHSPIWMNGSIFGAGAVTWCDGQAGCTGPVSTANSLVGSSNYDWIGSGGITSFKNGSYVVLSPRWNAGLNYDVGAATWCDGEKGCAGPISDSNSVVGAKAYDRVGNGGARELPNGTYLVLSWNYDNGQIPDAGAVTWCSIDVGCAGAINDANSILGMKGYAAKTLVEAYNLTAGWLIVIQPKVNTISLFK